MNFIILGDKFQKRMKSKGCIGLVQNNNKPIIEIQYKTIKKHFPLATVIYVTGFESKKLSNYLDKNKNLYKDIILVNNREYENYNRGYSLSLIQQYLNGQCFICLGDNTLKNTLCKFNEKKHCDTSKVFVSEQNNTGLGCVITDSVVENICYGLDNYVSDAYYLTSDHSLRLQKLIQDKKYHNYFVFELINNLIDQQQIFKPLIIG
jgi:CTP:phosphocholine cytidylyltransferase-like protein